MWTLARGSAEIVTVDAGEFQRHASFALIAELVVVDLFHEHKRLTKSAVGPRAVEIRAGSALRAIRE